MQQATAPGKIILVGEHAVVYGRPAIAAPVWGTVATAILEAGAPGSGCLIKASDLGTCMRLRDAGDEDPLATLTRLVLARLGITGEPDWQIELHSEIPIASGLGSGAAISTALVRVLFAQAGVEADPAVVSALVFESERFYHGTPSGIDNTVIAYGMPIWFVREQPPEPFSPSHTFLLAIADSGIRSPTKETVGAVRRGWLADPARYEARFDAIANLVRQARVAMEAGQEEALGAIMDQNQERLAELEVSSPQLEQMIAAAREAGALGAKLSGGGRGGNVIALVTESRASAVRRALLSAGARRVLFTIVGGAAS
ncbi:MAG: mevalonate kinase [Caldilineaceae bacterium]|nr:mevalonate kinase [Caldilineaceae bacterium]